MDDVPPDPFAGDPADPAAELAHLDPDEPMEPLSPEDRDDVLADLADLEVFRTLLEPRGIRGLVVDCDDCREPHFFGWELLQANLRSLLNAGDTHMHEPAFAPDPADYISWDYARGYTDGVLETSTDDET